MIRFHFYDKGVHDQQAIGTLMNFGKEEKQKPQSILQNYLK